MVDRNHNYKYNHNGRLWVDHATEKVFRKPRKYNWQTTGYVIVGKCRSLCENQDFRLWYNVKSGARYNNGQKFCRNCSLSFTQNIADVRFCPCCGTQLRAKPKDAKAKQKFRANQLQPSIVRSPNIRRQIMESLIPVCQ